MIDVDVKRTEIGRTPCYWVDSGRPTLHAILMFRHGLVDERLWESGRAHLLEHLALHDAETGALAVNGHVDLLTTGFTAHGPAQEVAAHISGLVAKLHDPDVSRMEAERKVLAAESAIRGDVMSRALSWRFGARGPGMAGYVDFAVSNASTDDLRQLARDAYTADNAVLVLDGPPPDEMSLDLPPGTRHRVPDAVPCEDELPGVYVENSGLVVSGLVPRNAAATLLPDVLNRMLFERFRIEAATAYAPWATYERVDNHQAVVVAGTDVSRGALQTLLPDAIDLVRSLAHSEVPEKIVRDVVAARLQAMRYPYGTAAFAMRAAYADLTDDESESPDALLKDIEAVDAEAIQEVAKSFRSSLMLALPGEARWENEVPRLEPPALPTPIRARRTRHRNWPAVTDRLMLKDGRLQVSAKPKDELALRTVDLGEVEGMLTFPDGARHLVDASGWTFTIHPREWSGGRAIVDEIDALVPTERRAPRSEEGQPTFERSPWYRRWGAAVRRVNSPLALFVIVATIVVLAFVVAAVFASPEVGTGIRSAVLGSLIVAGILNWVEKRKEAKAQGGD